MLTSGTKQWQIHSKIYFQRPPGSKVVQSDKLVLTDQFNPFKNLRSLGSSKWQACSNRPIQQLTFQNFMSIGSSKLVLTDPFNNLRSKTFMSLGSSKCQACSDRPIQQLTFHIFMSIGSSKCQACSDRPIQQLTFQNLNVHKQFKVTSFLWQTHSTTYFPKPSCP